jgi:polysaccharide chain length determinant protein (PEP-CTERM system associated)
VIRLNQDSEKDIMPSFRVRTPAEYLRLVWGRRYFILAPFIIVSAALCWAVYTLPNVYESSTLIIVVPPRVSSNYVQPVNQLDVNSRLSTIQKQVTSRTELQRIISRFGLYQAMIERDTPIELVIEEMQRHIFVRPQGTPTGANAFTIAFQGADPRAVRDVTAELAARFIDANSDETRREAYTTIDQLEEQIETVRSQLEKIEGARAGYLIRNPDAIPGQEQSMLGQMNSLSLIRQSQQSSIDALRAQISTNEQLLAAMKTRETVEPEPPLAAGQTEGQLRARRAELEAQLRQLLIKYTEKAPEVLAVRVQIETINRELDDLRNRTEQDRAARRAARSANPQVQSMEIKIATDRKDLERKQSELEHTNAQIAELQSRLRSTPLLATEATKIERDYDVLRKRYDDLVAKRDNAKFGAKVINDFSGETFRMQDPANLPEAPVSPKRRLLYPMSLIIGLFTGLIAAIAIEARAMTTIRDAKDVAHYTRLPLLVTVPKIVTAQERRHLPLLATAKVLGVMLLIAAAIPLLYQAIKISRVLDVLTGSQ